MAFDKDDSDQRLRRYKGVKMSSVIAPRVKMPKQPPEKRRRDFSEVAIGYSMEDALLEAYRCLICKKPRCVEGCPVGVEIPQFIAALRGGDVDGALSIIKRRNSLPGICGRVCPQEMQCESRCVLAKKGEAIAIGGLERFVADNAQSPRASFELRKPSGKRIAVVGSGPAGLTCAADLALMGHKVTIFEALHEAGGVLSYGIPEFRLPKRIVRDEVDYVRSLGVTIELDSVVGRSIGVLELLKEYDAIFLGIGAGAPRFLNIPGENLGGIYSANEYLTRINLMKAYMFPEFDTPIKRGKKVAVIGGGNVAMDAARCALRLGAEEVHVIYRRSEAEMPARREEIENAKEEGVIFDFLTNPVRFVGDGYVRAVECIEMELREPDSSGRRRPVEKRGSEHLIEIDTAIVAIGTQPNPLVLKSVPGLRTTRWGTIDVDERGRTSVKRIWAGGDIATGSATVISAMGAGRRAANDIDKWLREGGDWIS